MVIRVASLFQFFGHIKAQTEQCEGPWKPTCTFQKVNWNIFIQMQVSLNVLWNIIIKYCELPFPSHTLSTFIRKLKLGRGQRGFTK